MFAVNHRGYSMGYFRATPLTHRTGREDGRATAYFRASLSSGTGSPCLPTNGLFFVSGLHMQDRGRI